MYFAVALPVLWNSFESGNSEGFEDLRGEQVREDLGRGEEKREEGAF